MGAFKVELAAFAAQAGLEITVGHFPPGTSKWNKVEHRLFSFISMNWRGRPLTDYQVVIGTIAATTTETGLTVAAVMDTNTYSTPPVRRAADPAGSSTLHCGTSVALRRP